MSHARLYTAIFGVLFVLATVQVGVEFAGLLESSYWLAVWIIVVLSAAKALLVAGYYQHLRWEPRAVSYLAAGGLVVALALTAAAAYSIT
ncbi:cytochrome C oxidase subunit IV family protein [Halomicrobium salinisoli]|uniref:cytochrome C oxidase subunit IV family protein n=1 Tax=Halomicrobium salinisoli TaxID=2878391 RepID=UPI001CF0C21B|nr:cytochrome C oxidase subunit IV family protein [Halomicrobium salinisoli]